MDHDQTTRTQWLKDLALRHGFMGVGISRAERMEDEATRLESWLNQDFHGQMSYMANHFEMRIDPTRLVPGAKSVISLMYNYFPGKEDTDGISGEEGSPDQKSSASLIKIARYAYGEDYHKVVRRKLKTIVREMKTQWGDFTARVFVDSGPVLERDWAKRSGLGWIGKNTLLLDPKAGSYFFLAEIILDITFEYDHPIRDHCGTCTRCIDACPTEAISPAGYVLDGSKCISYLTIELKESIPEAFKGKMEGWIFGCDICQEVCPWNRFSKPHHEPAFQQKSELKNMSLEDWEGMTEMVFNDVFADSPLKRAGREKVLQTIKMTTQYS